MTDAQWASLEYRITGRDHSRPDGPTLRADVESWLEGYVRELVEEFIADYKRRRPSVPGPYHGRPGREVDVFAGRCPCGAGWMLAEPTGSCSCGRRIEVEWR